MWARASTLAEQTPADRNRYVDFLRALAISAVVLGHWVMAAPYFDGTAHMDHLLDIQPWSRWLTWFLQVMPIFFFVGGYSNGVSWDSAQRKQQPYGQWLEARLRRLLGPAVPLVIIWTLLGVIGFHTGVHPRMIQIGSQVSLVPVWFLAIYFIIVLLVPLTRIAWQRAGWWSVITPLALAILGDWVYFNTEQQWWGWFNYLFVWGGIHQLGYAWQQGRIGGLGVRITLACAGLLLLVVLTQFGPYPTSLVGVPSQSLSNTTPPKITLVALGLMQIGFFLSIENSMREWLERGRVWTATVLANGFIMPIFIWHSTVMMLVIGACFWIAPSLLGQTPGTLEWWLFRSVWILAYAILLFLFLPVFLHLEKLSMGNKNKVTPLTAVAVGGVLFCAGLALLAKGGVTGQGLWGIHWLAVSLPVVAGLLISLSARQQKHSDSQ